MTSMETVKASPPSSSYDILIGDGILRSVSSALLRTTEKSPSSIAIIADSNVARRYGSRLAGQFSKITKTNLLRFPAGEKNKNLRTASILASKLSKLGVDRYGLIVALGGGVTGDLAGFVASIYKRGIAYIQIPTTLLAQVDSSIGGKTGVDTDWGKNQLGTFYQPKCVLVDPSVLLTLPKSQLINGTAEMIKYGVIGDKNLFDGLSNADLQSVRDLKKFIPNCCKIKAEIISKDEREENLRSILNYGHTVGHAIEAASQYSIGHGEAIVLGMLAEGWIARELGFFGEDDFERQKVVLQSFDVTRKAVKLRQSDLLRFARADKKVASGVMRMSLPERIGAMHRDSKVSYQISVTSDVFSRSIHYVQSL
jgi:3-dehydroquinate synthase